MRFLRVRGCHSLRVRDVFRRKQQQGPVCQERNDNSRARRFIIDSLYGVLVTIAAVTYIVRNLWLFPPAVFTTASRRGNISW
jgi:hypothetical protein